MEVSRMTRRALALTALALLMTAAPTGAQGIDILYSPLVYELAGQRGTSVPFEITIINESLLTTAYFQTSVTSLWETPDGVYRTRPAGDVGEWEYDASTWVELETNQFAVAPQSAYILRGRVNIPRRGPASGYATVVVELIPEPKPADVAAATFYHQRFTTALEITVGNQHRRSAYISELHVIPTASAPELATVYGPNALLFVAALKNDGDVHVRGQGQLIIRDAMGRRIRTVPLGSGRGVVIPGAILNFGSVLPVLPPGNYEMEARINYGGHRPAVARTKFEISDAVAGVSSVVGGRALRVDATPAEIHLSLTRQGYRAATITLANYDTIDVRFRTSAADLFYDLGGVPVDVGPEVTLPTSARDWVQIRPEEIVLGPGQRRNIVIGFQVPEGQEGGRYARIRIVAEPASASGAPEAGQVVTDLDVAAFLTLGTEHVRQLAITDLQFQQVQGTATVMVGAVVSNTGNIHERTMGRFTLLRYIPPSEEVIGDLIVQRDGRWEAVEQAVAEMAPTPILPGESRFMQAAFQTPLEPGVQYQVVVEAAQSDGRPPVIERFDLWTDASGLVRPGGPPEEGGTEGEGVSVP